MENVEKTVRKTKSLNKFDLKLSKNKTKPTDNYIKR